MSEKGKANVASPNPAAYLTKFLLRILVVSLPVFAVVALFLNIPPGKLAVPFAMARTATHARQPVIPSDASPKK
jgi:hypothetical protein